MSLLKKLFGSKKREMSPIQELVEKTIATLIEKAGFELEFFSRIDKNDKDEDILILELSGADEEIIRDREGQVIDGLQLFLKRVVQHHYPDDRTDIVIDCNGYLEENNQQLIELAEKLKAVALEKGRSVYIRALPPKDRKIVHQHLALDARVKSRSVGEGLYKKIQIHPVKAAHTSQNQNEEMS